MWALFVVDFTSRQSKGFEMSRCMSSLGSQIKIAHNSPPAPPPETNSGRRADACSTSFPSSALPKQTTEQVGTLILVQTHF